MKNEEPLQPVKNKPTSSTHQLPTTVYTPRLEKLKSRDRY